MAPKDLPDAEKQLQAIRARARTARELRVHREKQASDDEDSFGLFSMLGPLVLAPAIALGLYLAYVAPSNPFEKGDALLAGGDAEGAERIFARAVAQQPLFAYANIKLGITLVAQERRREALDRFQTAIELGGADRVARKLMSRTALRVAEEALDASPEDARVLLNRALEVSPEDSDVHASLGVALQRSGDTRRAIACLIFLGSLNPRFF
jgi:tetratricopeptide (TPR) repeat protein